MSDAIELYATDEDIATWAPSDFALLCPREQVLAAGNDGTFSGTDRWLLRSASVDFTASGLAPGHVVQLLGPAAAFRGGTDVLVVDQVVPGGVRLRRKGQASGVGQPPSPASGLTGVEFLVTTFTPQIAAASYSLNRRYGIDERLGGSSPADLYDVRELREAAVLSVLSTRYLDLGQGTDGTLAEKARVLKSQLDELLDRIALHWNTAAGLGGAATTRFGTKINR